MNEIESFLNNAKHVLKYYQKTNDPRAKSLDTVYKKQLELYENKYIEFNNTKCIELIQMHIKNGTQNQIEEACILRLANLIEMYDENREYENMIPLLEYSLDIAINSTKGMSTEEALNYLASTYLSMRRYEEASKYFKEYFEYMDFNQEYEIQWFIYAFVKYYQTEIQLNRPVQELQSLAEKLISLYKNRLGDTYVQTIQEEEKGYIAFAKSENNDFARQKYEIFVKLFEINPLGEVRE